MNLGSIGKYKSWLTSAGIAIAIAIWLASGNMASDDVTTEVTADTAPQASTRTSVRVRTQAAEEVTRVINVMPSLNAIQK